MPAPPPPSAPRSGDANDASHCLKVDSDGSHWGFRNACDFAVQFAYCMAGGGDNLTACGKDVTVSVAGSVAANGFGALMADTSLLFNLSTSSFQTIANDIAGDGFFDMQGPAGTTLNLAGNNSWTGVTIIELGTLQLQNAASLSSNSILNIYDFGALENEPIEA